MRIRKRYVQVVEAIAKREGVRNAHANFRLSAKATRQQCIRYALKYVVRHTTPHYRYDLYECSLRWALRASASQIDLQSPILHLDLGCGPGLFTWVVQDYFLGKSPTVRFFGYDHSSEMIRFAEEIWPEVCEGVPASWHHDPDDMLSNVLFDGPRHQCSLATFGHALAQTHNQEDTIGRFAQIISQFLQANCLVVAVDALNATKCFQLGCEGLEASLRQENLHIDVLQSNGRRFFANVRR